MIEQRIKSIIKDIPDFPQPGILFKDITPIFRHPDLVREIVSAFTENLPSKPDAILSIESRGFFFGLLMAVNLNVPFIPVRKKGKLPGETIAHAYDLEYGSAVIEVQKDALSPGQRVMIHDDLLATGGTAAATGELVKKLSCSIHSFTFLVELDFLNGRKSLSPYGAEVSSLIHF